MSLNEEYFQDYKIAEGSQEIKDSSVEFDRLCHAVFSTTDGILLMEYLNKHVLNRTFVNPTHPQAANIAIYYAGFEEAFRIMQRSVDSHAARIKHEANKEKKA